MIKDKLSSTKKYGIILLVLLIIIFTSQIFGVPNFTGSVQIDPENATSTQNLECSWTVTGEETINVTWYKNSVVFNSSTSVTSPWKLPKIHTTKNDKWNCTVIAINTSSAPSEVLDSDTVLIDNSAPVSSYIGNSTGQDIGSVEHILEGKEYTFWHVANDPDNDGLTYLVIQSSYCSVNSGTGEITCNSTSQPNLTTKDKFDFLVTDGDKYSGETLYINVTPVNDRPDFLVPLEDESIEENQTLQYKFSMTDEESSSGFTVNISSNYSDNRLQNITFDTIEFIIQFNTNRTADFDDRGNYTVYITACDPLDNSLCVDGNFNLEVTPLNQRPNITNISYQPRTQEQNFTLYVNATDPDDSDTLTFSVSSGCGISNPWSIQTLDGGPSNARGIINTTLTNDHIACKNITITVEDSVGQTDSREIILLITNVNDYPIIYNYSYYDNTQGNKYIKNLTAYTNVSFQYKINATDPDLITDSNEFVTFYDNSSNCNGNCPSLWINSSDGTIRFMPNITSLQGQSSKMYHYEINVTDFYGLSYVTIMNITIYNNTPPYFSPDLIDKTASERVVFTYDIDAYDYQNDVITYEDDVGLFEINQSGVINFTPVCNNIGNYTVTITVTDEKGAFTEESFDLEIQNTQDAPQVAVIPNSTLIEEKPFYLDVSSSVTDLDIDCSKVEDSVNYSSQFLFGSTLFVINETTGIISYTPNTSSDGGYIVEVTVTDTFGLSDSFKLNLTVVNRTRPPEIHNITPYGYPTVFNWTDVSDLGSNFTTINVSEGTTVVFDHNSTDPENNDLLFNWTVDGVTVGTEKNLSYYFDYSSSGLRDIVLIVSDAINGTIDHSVNFTWNTSVRNFNRAPRINDSLPNVRINRTKEISDYLSGGLSETRFWDPDGDILTYNWTSSSIVTINRNGDDVTFTPEQVGVAYIYFTASDGFLSVTSNNVTVNVTSVPEPPPASSNDNTRTSTSDTPIPYSVIEEVEKEKQVYLDILVPQVVTVYRNNTVREVIKIVNKGNTTLRGIYLSAKTNFTDAEISFSDDYFPELLPGAEEKTDLIITAYKLMNHYEIVLYANVTDPEYQDKAVVYVNAIEKSRGNQSVTSTKITFARDLLSSNPECLELNEFLKQAQAHMENGQYDKASDILDSVIQGCKYLVSQSRLEDESPSGFAIALDLEKTPYIKPILITFVVVMVGAIVLTIRAKKINEQKEE